MAHADSGASPSYVNQNSGLLTKDNKANRQPVSSVGRASDYRAGGLGFEPQTEPTLRALK